MLVYGHGLKTPKCIIETVTWCCDTSHCMFHDKGACTAWFAKFNFRFSRCICCYFYHFETHLPDQVKRRLLLANTSTCSRYNSRKGTKLRVHVPKWTGKSLTFLQSNWKLSRHGRVTLILSMSYISSEDEILEIHYEMIRRKSLNEILENMVKKMHKTLAWVASR